MVAGFALSLGFASAEEVETATRLRASGGRVNLSSLTTPVIFKGDTNTAYRDPTAIYHDGVFRLYFTLVNVEPDGKPYSFTAWSKSTNLTHWTEPRVFTPRDLNLERLHK